MRLSIREQCIIGRSCHHIFPFEAARGRSCRWLATEPFLDLAWRGNLYSTRPFADLSRPSLPRPFFAPSATIPSFSDFASRRSRHACDISMPPYLMDPGRLVISINAHTDRPIDTLPNSRNFRFDFSISSHRRSPEFSRWEHRKNANLT